MRFAHSDLNLTYDWHIILLWMCTLIALVVFFVMFNAIVHYRKSKGREATLFHKKIYVELIWAIIPLIIVIMLVIPTIYSLK